ncbi:hypothetical protein ACOY5L_26040, partial [Escherichia coli]|uniref:hypothetical protein n=1 Tax=Escherichia coli TaxID=562 RepID=UPI003BD9C41A
GRIGEPKKFFTVSPSIMRSMQHSRAETHETRAGHMTATACGPVVPAGHEAQIQGHRNRTRFRTFRRGRLDRQDPRLR